MKDRELRAMLEQAGLISYGYQNTLRVTVRGETIRSLEGTVDLLMRNRECRSKLRVDVQGEIIRSLEQKLNLLMQHLGVTVDYDARIKTLDK